MKKIPASFNVKKILLGACLIGVAGCSSMPHVFGGNEVPEGALNAPRLVAGPSQKDLADQTWPRLGDVPSKPNDFSSPPDIVQSRTEMENARTNAAATRAQSGIDMAPPRSSSQPQGF